MKYFLILALFLLPFSVQAEETFTQRVAEQLVRNLHGGVEVRRVNGQTHYFAYAGTGYRHYFLERRAHLFPQIQVRWGQFRPTGDRTHYIETTSLALPVTLGYNVARTALFNMNVHAGVRYEQILRATTRDTYTSRVNNAQFGILGGVSTRVMQRFGIRISYYYGLTSLFRDGTGRDSSFSFEFTF